MDKVPVAVFAFPSDEALATEFQRLISDIRFPQSITVALLSAAPGTMPAGPTVVVALEDLPLPACLASLRISGRERLAQAATWVRGVLTAGPRNPYWAQRLALASADIDRNRRSVFRLADGSGSVAGLATAIGPNRLIGPPVPDPHILSEMGTVPIQAAENVGSYVLYDTETTLTYCTAGPVPSDPAVVAFTLDAANQLVPTPGWLFDLPRSLPGTPIFSLSSGDLIGIGQTPIRDLLPEAPSTGLESNLEMATDSALEATVSDYSDRKGYDSRFLGVEVPLPKSSLPVQLLHYTNFSVGQSPDRRMALYTAVNIHGRNLVAQTRAGDPWRLDPRIPRKQQLGATFYEGTPLDRGHMVRRLDPVWGEDSAKAELDTFHYPNSTPQHRDLNRKTWNDLEDYVYLNAQKEDLKVSVFTGPVLRPDDPPFHGAQLPREFWKVVVIRRSDNQRLSATAYLLTQEEMISGLEFAFGAFRTYQLSVKAVEKKTGLDFGNLRNFDPKARSAGLESAVMPAPIENPADLDLGLGQGLVATPAVLRTELVDALQSFDWKTVRHLTSELAECVEIHPEEFDARSAANILVELRGKRRFPDMARLAETFLHKGVSSPQVLRQYAQSLIDQGVYYASELVLRTLPGDKEAQGLIGRIHKQLYMNGHSASNGARLQAAISAYWAVYLADKQEVWHGINAVALLMRARRDGIPPNGYPEPAGIAREILDTLDERQAETGSLLYWDEATAMEAHLALGDHSGAIARAKSYVVQANAFALASTLRQLEEVWQHSDKEAPGEALLPLFRAHLLRAEGGGLQLAPESTGFQLEKVFGLDRSVTLEWYEQGLRSARSIARIEINGAGLGTGWLVDSMELMGTPGPPVLVTNAHVIGPDTPDRYPNAARIEDVTINFEIQKHRVRAVKALHHSPVHKLDCTVVELSELPPGAEALKLDTQPLKVDKPPQRLYVIGHPGGRSIEFSLQDNHLLAANDRLIHYRTPTEGGSSGSPVFGSVGWKVVALHHAGRKDMPRIDGEPGFYEANEGIAIGEICRFARGGNGTP
jgi:DNA/RNA endonuclease G (NUC1)